MIFHLLLGRFKMAAILFMDTVVGKKFRNIESKRGEVVLHFD